VFVPHREQRLFIGAALGFGKKLGKFVAAGQFAVLQNLMNGEYYQITALVVRLGNSMAGWGLTKVRPGFILQGYFEILVA
jgi:hypothetical protein